MVEFLASSTQVIRRKPSVRSLPDLPTAVPAFVGIAERGPLNTPTRVTSFDDYRRLFGGNKSGAIMSLEVRQFFQNGGRQADIVRVLEGSPASAAVTLLTGASAPTAGSVTGTLIEPFLFAPADTIIVNVDAAGDLTATFDAAAAAVTGANTETFALVDGDTMTFIVDTLAKSVTFNTAEFVAIGAATALEVAAVINAEVTGIQATVAGGAVVITTDSKGTASAIGTFADGSGTPTATLGFTGLSDTGTGDVTNIEAVTVAEIKTVMEADIAGLTINDVGGAVQIVSDTTGASSTIAVNATSTADTKIGVDNATHTGTTGAAGATIITTASSAGDWANQASTNGLQIRIDPPTSGLETGVAAEFNYVVVQGGVDAENFPNVTLDATKGNYVETVVNSTTAGSELVTVADQISAAPAPDNRPAVGTFDLVGGTEGSAVSDATFTGGTDPAKGINTLELRDITLLAIPDRATTAVQNAMITFSEITRNREVFAILDPPASSDAAGIVTHRDSLTTSEQAALYWPRLQIPNPDTAVFGTAENILIGVSGSVAGVMARTDAASLIGAFEQPAGIEIGRIFGVVELETENHEVIKLGSRAIVTPKQINPITRPLTGGTIFLDGTEVLDVNGNFPSVGESRGVSSFERRAKAALEFVRHRPNTSRLRRSVERTLRGPLNQLTKDGAFASTNPDLAFSLNADISGTGINNPSVQKQKKLFVAVGLATASPAKFIVVLVSQDTQALDAAA